MTASISPAMAAH